MSKAKARAKKSRRNKRKAKPDKQVCLKEGQVKTLVDNARGVGPRCKTAADYIASLDEAYDNEEEEEEGEEEGFWENLKKNLEDFERRYLY